MCHLCGVLKLYIAIEIFLFFSPFSCCFTDKASGFGIEYLCLAVFLTVNARIFFFFSTIMVTTESYVRAGAKFLNISECTVHMYSWDTAIIIFMFILSLTLHVCSIKTLQ